MHSRRHQDPILGKNKSEAAHQHITCSCTKNIKANYFVETYHERTGGFPTRKVIKSKKGNCTSKFYRLMHGIGPLYGIQINMSLSSYAVSTNALMLIRCIVINKGLEGSSK